MKVCRFRYSPRKDKLTSKLPYQATVVHLNIAVDAESKWQLQIFSL
jgi:hypothetical protein